MRLIQVLPYLGFAACSPLLSDTTRAYLDEALTRWRVSGLSLVAISNSTTEYYTHGVANAAGDAVTQDTRFGIGSNSKLFTALSIATLIADETPLKLVNGTLEARTKARDVLPDWALLDEYASAHVDISDLMAMRSGLPRHDYALSGHAVDAEVVANLRHLPLTAEIRQSYQYCNMHYAALAHMVTTLTGVEYTDWVAEHVIAPLGLNATYDYETSGVADGFAHIGVNHTQCAMSEDARHPDKACLGEVKPFGWWVTGPYVKGADAGAGGLMMSARDVGKWLTELLDPKHVNPAALALVSAPMVVAEPARPPELGPTTYGAGQAIVNYRGQEVVHHGGFVPGQASEFLRVPAAGVALGIMTNDHTWGEVLVSPLAWRVLDDLLGLEPIDWEARSVGEMWDAIRSEPTPWPPKKPEPAPALGKGTYAHPGYGAFTLTPLPHGKPNTTEGEIARGLPLLNLRTDSVLYAELDSFLPSHFTLTHWSGAFWNLTNWLVYDRHGVVALNPGMSWPAVVTDEGMGVFGGFAGAGIDVPPREPGIEGLREKAEVFFAREGRSPLVVQSGAE